ncbi:hypothetical protein GCM10009118_21230 [Wandonia haliotis]|uniref:Uncharacterized protein n=1 Tax=Wandonia haliotis TaxID=574963 RepID=A0ABP3Y4T7_9FLAO
MSFKKFNIEILEAIESVDLIISSEDFSAYHQIRKSLIDALNFLFENKKTDAQKHLLLCIRLLMEAPTKNKELGLETLVKIDSIYKRLSAQSS